MSLQLVTELSSIFLAETGVLRESNKYYMLFILLTIGLHYQIQLDVAA